MIRQKYRLYLILFLTSYGASFLFADTESNQITLSKIDITIDGKTSEKALMRELQISEGQVYDSLADLNLHLEGRLQPLLNRRLFRDFEYQVEESTPGNAEITITLKDSFTLIPRPMIKYSSSQGVTLGLWVQYYNAFGSLMDLSLQGYWSPTEYLFNLNSSNMIVGPFKMDAEVQQNNSTTRRGDNDGNTILDYRYSQTLVNIGFTAPLGRSGKWFANVRPKVSWLYSYDFVTNNTGEDNSQLNDTGFSPGIDVGINYEGYIYVSNFRFGTTLAAELESTYYSGSNRWDSFLEIDTTGYLAPLKWLSVSGRIGGFYALDGIREDAGDRIRGVLDYNAYGTWAPYINAEIGFRLFSSEKIGEFVLSGFFDGGYVYSPDRGYSDENWEGGAGFSINAFFSVLPSLVLRVDLGWDLKRGGTELIIDTSHFF